MAYASQSGRARTSAKSPRAFAVCQRCGIWWNRDQLNFQYDWRGAQLQNLYVLVCPHCYDTPQAQLRAITLPADPVPVFYPSVEDFVGDESDYRSLSAPTVIDPRTGIPVPNTVLRTTQNCLNRTTEPYGEPDGLDPNAVMPYNGGVQQAFGIVLPIISVLSFGNDIVAVTCSAPHNMVQQNNPQVSVQGLSNTAANGFYSVTITTATAFTYQTYGSIAAGSLLTSGTRIATALVGLPYGYTQIPQISGSPLVTVPYIATEGGDIITTEGGVVLEEG
jgi:hypothetical protein